MGCDDVTSKQVLAKSMHKENDIVALKNCLREAAISVQKCVAEYSFGVENVGGGKSQASEGAINESGDRQLDLDVAADLAVEEALRNCPLVAGVLSEERKGFVETNPAGQYVVAFDPLDGSQNVPVGITVGSIYGVFRGSSPADIASASKARDRLVCAAYGLHSAALLFNFADTESRPSLERWDAYSKEWITVKKEFLTPEKGKTYCINEGNFKNWADWTRDFVGSLKSEKRSTRWMACMVSDVHRPLLQGGIFAYPEDAKYTGGRLRLVYEAMPMALLWEQAGGTALSSVDEITGEFTHILDRPFPAEDIHCRSGVVLLGRHETRVLRTVVPERAPAASGELQKNAALALQHHDFVFDDR